MRIISNFRDYYDSVQMYGYDPNLIYHRTTVEYDQFNPELKRRLPDDIHMALDPIFNIVKSMPRYLKVKGQRRDQMMRPSVIGFCGKLIPMFMKDGAFNVYGNDPPTWEYNLDNIGDIESDGFSIFSEQNLNLTTWGNVLKQCDQKFDAVFQALKSPLFMVQSSRWIYDITINPQLKKYKFYRLVPATEAYQSIAMYLGCQLATESIVHNVPDKYLIEKKGFDIKTSFRHRK